MFFLHETMEILDILFSLVLLTEVVFKRTNEMKCTSVVTVFGVWDQLFHLR